MRLVRGLGRCDVEVGYKENRNENTLIFLIVCLAWAVVSDKIFMTTLPLRSHIRRWLRKVKKS